MKLAFCKTKLLQKLGVVLLVFSTYSESINAADIIITESSGAQFTSADVIDKYSFRKFPAQESKKFFSLSDEGLFARKTWDADVYGTQGSLIAKKLLGFGAPDDLQRIRSALLAAPIDRSAGYGGIVDSTTSSREHVGSKYSIESNLEFIIMARDYLAHSGDLEIFRAPVSRVLCVQMTSGLIAATHRAYWEGFNCNGSPRQGGNKVFEQRPHMGFVNRIDNPALALQQTFRVYDSISAIRLGMANPGEVKHASFRVVLYNNDLQRTFFDQTYRDPQLINDWFNITFSSALPPGSYNLGMFPVADSDIAPSASYWYSLGWLTEAGNTTTGGATTSRYSYNVDPFVASNDAWNIATKVEFAMNWALQQALSTGRLGVFITPYAMNSGTTNANTRSSTYYDLFKSGYKDSYTNMLFLKALIAYKDLELAGAARHQFSQADIDAVAQDITNQFSARTGGNGALMSWIGKDGNHRWLGLLAPHAMAANLPMPQSDKIRAVFDILRSQSRIANGYFRTNLVPVESVGPLLWDANQSWGSYITVNGIPGFANYNDTNLTGDWHIFSNNIGYGNYGLQENNGGVLLGTTSYVFAAGPYPEMYQDYKGLTSSIRNIATAIESNNFNGYSMPSVRKPVTEPRIFSLCNNARSETGTDLDSQGAMMCGFYKNISYNLPESGAFPVYFAEGILRLNISATGQLTAYGIPLTAQEVNIAIPKNRFPTEINRVEVTGYNVYGKATNIVCRRLNTSAMACSQTP